MKVGAPIIGLNDSGGAQIRRSVVSLGGYADIFLRNTLASGVVPQLSVVMGPCAGGAVYSPAITDFTIMVEGTSYMFVTGPNVVKAVTHEDVDAETLGGATTHTTRSGVARIAAHDEGEALAYARRVLAHLPQDNLGDAPRGSTTDPTDRRDVALDAIVPDDPSKPYDMHRVIELVVDDAGFLEIQPGWAPNIITGFARLGGRSVGIVAQQLRSPGRRARHRCVDQGSAIRADVQVLQRPVADLRRRARVHAWGGAGHGDRPARREVVVRVLRGHGSEAHGHHAKGIWRRV